MKTLKLLTLVAAIQCLPAFTFAQSGADMFKQNCGACHTVGGGKLVGPDLKGVLTRHPMAWLYKWIKSSQTLVKSGDKAAVKLFNDNSMIPMPDQALTKDQVTTILDYIKSQSGGATASTDNTTAAVPVAPVAVSTPPPANAPVQVNDGYTPLVYSGIPAVYTKQAPVKMEKDDIWPAYRWWVLVIILVVAFNVGMYYACAGVIDDNSSPELG